MKLSIVITALFSVAMTNASPGYECRPEGELCANINGTLPGVCCPWTTCTQVSRDLAYCREKPGATSTAA